MLNFKSVDIRVGTRSLMKIDEMTINSGVVALIGRNGAGKSTLLKSIIGQHKDIKGSIQIKNKEVKEYTATDLAKEVAIVYTKPELFGRHTAKDIVALGRLPYQNFMAKITKKDKDVVEEVMNILELHEVANQMFNSLSDGEKQLVMIGRALAQETEILLLDEPAAFLDIVNKQKLMRFVQRIAEKTNKLILFSTHQIDILEKYCDSIVLIDKQKIQHLSDKKRFVSAINTAFQINSKQNEV